MMFIFNDFLLATRGYDTGGGGDKVLTENSRVIFSERLVLTPISRLLKFGFFCTNCIDKILCVQFLKNYRIEDGRVYLKFCLMNFGEHQMSDSRVIFI